MTQDEQQNKIGIIAGGGEAPRRLMDALRRAGRDFFLICLDGHADAGLGDGADHVWLPLGAAGRALAAARDKGVRELVLIGHVKRPSLSELKPDWFLLQRLPRLGLAALGDDGVLQAIGGIIAEEGFRLLGAHEIFTDFLAPAGILGRHAPDDGARQDVARGIAVATALGRLDVGQAVVVQQGLVLGVEAIEGTDALLARTASLRRDGGGGVLVKLCKPQQDRRFDLPAMGVATVQNAAAAGLCGIAVHAGASLMIDRDATIRAADEAGLFLIGVEETV